MQPINPDDIEIKDGKPILLYSGEEGLLAWQKGRHIVISKDEIIC